MLIELQLVDVKRWNFGQLSLSRSLAKKIILRPQSGQVTSGELIGIIGPRWAAIARVVQNRDSVAVELSLGEAAGLLETETATTVVMLSYER